MFLLLYRAVDNVLNNIDRTLNDMTIKVWRPFATNAIVHVILGRVLKAAFVFKGIMIEWITVKGFDENFDEIDDLWTESRHKVFRKVQNHTHSAMLHFYSPTLPDLAVRSFMVSPQSQFLCFCPKSFDWNGYFRYRRGFTATFDCFVILARNVEIIYLTLFHRLGETYGHWNHSTRNVNNLSNRMNWLLTFYFY